MGNNVKLRRENMKIKKEFLNEESLKPYGFQKKVLYNDERYVEYEMQTPHCKIFTQRCSGTIAIVIQDCDCANIDDVLFHLIKDGIVEI